MVCSDPVSCKCQNLSMVIIGYEVAELFGSSV